MLVVTVRRKNLKIPICVPSFDGGRFSRNLGPDERTQIRSNRSLWGIDLIYSPKGSKKVLD